MHSMFVYDLRWCAPQYFTESLYEKKQSIMTNDTEFAKLQAQVEGLESISTEKDTCIAEHEAIVKGSEGEVVW